METLTGLKYTLFVEEHFLIHCHCLLRLEANISEGSSIDGVYFIESLSAKQFVIIYNLLLFSYSSLSYCYVRGFADVLDVETIVLAHKMENLCC